MSKKQPMFVFENKDGEIAGFCTIKKTDVTTAYLHLLYLHENFLNKGLGRSAVRFLESYIVKNWP